MLTNFFPPLVICYSCFQVHRVKKKKYLVKWRGLSYRDCTWETAKDTNDDAKIAEYHRTNDAPPDEPPLTQAEIGIELAKDRRTQQLPATLRPHAVQDLDATIYAQIRALHFLRWQKVCDLSSPVCASPNTKHIRSLLASD